MKNFILSFLFILSALPCFSASIWIEGEDATVKKTNLIPGGMIKSKIKHFPVEPGFLISPKMAPEQLLISLKLLKQVTVSFG